MKDLQTQGVQKQKERMSDVMMRKSQNSWMNMSAMSMTLKREQPSRGSDW